MKQCLNGTRKPTSGSSYESRRYRVTSSLFSLQTCTSRLVGNWRYRIAASVSFLANSAAPGGSEFAASSSESATNSLSGTIRDRFFRIPKVYDR